MYIPLRSGSWKPTVLYFFSLFQKLLHALVGIGSYRRVGPPVLCKADLCDEAAKLRDRSDLRLTKLQNKLYLLKEYDGKHVSFDLTNPRSTLPVQDKSSFCLFGSRSFGFLFSPKTSAFCHDLGLGDRGTWTSFTRQLLSYRRRILFDEHIIS